MNNFNTGPLTSYAVKNMWGNRELDSQYQLKLDRITPIQGWVGEFFHGGKQWRLPSETDFYHIYAMGGLSTNFWNMFNTRMDWYPFNTWVQASTISNDRGVDLIVYQSGGRTFPRSKTYVLNTFDGHTFVAVPVSKAFRFPMTENTYIRCYSSDINTANISQENQAKWRFGYFAIDYLQAEDWEAVQRMYNTFIAYGMGHVSFIVNGVGRDYAGFRAMTGDLIEVAYDPTIGQVIRYDFTSLNDFYSTLDSRRKLLLFSGQLSKPRKYLYFDDNEFLVRNKRTGRTLYYHRNKADAIRQLTHQDYALTASYVEFLIGQLIALDTTNASTESDMEIVVLYRNTKWQFDVGPCISRINDLYLLEDPSLILRAMVGTNSTVKEWSAPELEKSMTNIVLNAIYQELTTDTIRNALGYNGCGMALSNTPLCMPWIVPGDPDYDDTVKHAPYETGLGYRVPASYVETSTAYEYSKEGLFIRKTYLQQREYFAPGDHTWYVEFAVGKASSWLDYTISRSDVQLRPGYGFRVYQAGWLLDDEGPAPDPRGLFKNEFELSKDGFDRYPEPTEVPILVDGEPVVPGQLPPGGKPDGKWVDITGTDKYTVNNGYLSWNFGNNHSVGLVVFDTIHLYNEFELEHLDNSMFLTVTREWEIGGIPLLMEPGQLDLWCNQHPLIENVDYIVDFPRIYIISKMWLNENGKNKFAYRGIGLSKTGLIPSSELGFVQSGCVGFNGRYNLRIDRPTKTVVNGRLFLTEDVDWAEDIDHGNNMLPYNGMPYEVKHIYVANKYVAENDLYWGFEESRKLDSQIVDYLTEKVEYKPEVDPEFPYLEKDRYRLFSPFMSQLVNEMVLGFLRVPKRDDSEIGYSDQAIDDLTRSYQWLLEFDPIVKKMDDRFFSFHPYSNIPKPTVTPDQLTVIGRVNDLYLGGKIRIEGFFEVKRDV